LTLRRPGGWKYREGGQHFLLSPKANGLTLASVAAMDEEAAYEWFKQARWPSTGGEPTCPECGLIGATPRRKRRFRCRAKAGLPLAADWQDACLMAGSQNKHDTVDGGNVGRQPGQLGLQLAFPGNQGAPFFKNFIENRRHRVTYISETQLTRFSAPGRGAVAP
jgi:hypothetical protein